MGPMHQALEAYKERKAEAHEAFGIYRGYCNGHVPPRVPGMDTVIRLAFRISRGWTIQEAAAREYIYRWHLAILPSNQVLGTSVVDPCVSIFGAPHAIGM